MLSYLTLAIIVAALAVVFLAGRALSMRKAGLEPRGRKLALAGGAVGAPAGAPVGEELVAVIAAAVAATSGMEIGSFRIAGLSPSSPASRAERGFNTPVWGHIDRINRGDQA